MRILEIVAAIVDREIFWVPVLLLVFNQILKISFSLLKLLNNTLKEVFLTIGAELCVLGISVHITVIARSDTNFGKYFSPDKKAPAAVILLVMYFGMTALSLLFLKLAMNEIHSPLDDQADYWKHVLKIGSFLGLSIAIGFVLFALVVSTV